MPFLFLRVDTLSPWRFDTLSPWRFDTLSPWRFDTLSPWRFQYSCPDSKGASISVVTVLALKKD